MKEGQLGGLSAPNGRMLNAPGTKEGMGRQTEARRGRSTSPYLTHSALVVPCSAASPVPVVEKRGGRERPLPKAGDHVAPWGSLPSESIPGGKAIEPTGHTNDCTVRPGDRSDADGSRGSVLDSRAIII